MSRLLISNVFGMVIGPRNVLIECLTRARAHIHTYTRAQTTGSMSLLYAEIVHAARGEIRFRFEVVSRTSFRSGDPIISVVPFHASSCQSGLMVSRWNVRCLSDSSTDIYEVRTRHDIRSIHAIYLIVFPFTATAL